MKLELRIITVNSSTSGISNISHNVSVLLVVEDAMIILNAITAVECNVLCVLCKKCWYYCLNSLK